MVRVWTSVEIRVPGWQNKVGAYNEACRRMVCAAVAGRFQDWRVGESTYCGGNTQSVYAVEVSVVGESEQAIEQALRNEFGFALGTIRAA